MTASERPGWQDPRILALLLFVFLSGAAVGALTMRSRTHVHPARFWTTENVSISYESLRRELNLTPEQSDKLRSILDDFVSYHHDMEEQVKSYRATGKNRILQILTPEQRAKFEQISSDISPR